MALSSSKVSSSRPHQPAKFIVPPTSDRVDRTSFSSIKESKTGVAQSFTDSKISSYLRHQYELNGSDEDAIQESNSSEGTPPLEPEELEPISMLNTQSTLHNFVCPCDGFRGWKTISIKGKVASKSFGDLKSLAMRWEWTPKPGIAEEKRSPLEESRNAVEKNGAYPSGQSPFERLPIELLGAIIDSLYIDLPPSGYTSRNIDLMSLLLTSREIHSATLGTLYSQITIPHSRIFLKFLAHIKNYPSLGTIVRRIDFAHYNPTMAGQSVRERHQTKYLIPATLLQCLDLTPNLREFLAQEYIDNELDTGVIRKLLCDLPKLKALDLCACVSDVFRKSMVEILQESPSALPETLTITRLGLHECATLPAMVFDTLLPRMPYLTHLDVTRTRITDEALHSIPNTARLTHLSLSNCASLSGEAIVRFLVEHPAAKTLICVNLAMNHEKFSTEDLTTLLPHLPGTLRSLNLKGSQMDASHIPLLLPLTKHLEELGVGSFFDLHDMERLLFPDESAPLEEQLAWTPHNLHYIDASDLTTAQLKPHILLGSSCPILTAVAAPLDVLEVSRDVYKRLGRVPPGLRFNELGRRHWVVREGSQDDGARPWKWGATNWGMRKLPLARAEVGGMYGHYMFKR